MGVAPFQDLLQKVQVVKMSLSFLFFIMLYCHLLSVQLSFPLYNETCANKGNGVLVYRRGELYTCGCCGYGCHLLLLVSS